MMKSVSNDASTSRELTTAGVPEKYLVYPVKLLVLQWYSVGEMFVAPFLDIT